MGNRAARASPVLEFRGGAGAFKDPFGVALALHPTHGDRQVLVVADSEAQCFFSVDLKSGTHLISCLFVVWVLLCAE
jgi:hypothetical protein